MPVQNTEFEKELYQEAYAFLIETHHISEDVINKHLIPEEIRTRPAKLNLIYKALLESAQNVQMSPNVIGKAISGRKGDIDPLSVILFGFDPKKTCERYRSYSAEKLFADISPQLIYPPAAGRNTLWLRFCKTIISSSVFMSQFNSYIEFYEFVDNYYHDDRMRPFLPMLLSYEIDGLGFALSCDFLKEMGYVKFGKPDTHVKDVFVALGLLGTVAKNSSKADYLSLRILESIAMANNTTAYAVDKLLWLIGSGNFYLEKLEMPSRKDEFIQHMKQRQQNNPLHPTVNQAGEWRRSP